MIRILQHDGRPTQLGEAIARYGRIFKTLHVLTFVDDPAYRRAAQGHAQPAGRPPRPGPAHLPRPQRASCTRAYHAGMEDQLGALGLVLNCVTLWNTLYLDHALSRAARPGLPGADDRRGPSLGLPAPPHQRPRPLLVRPARPRRRPAPLRDLDHTDPHDD